MMFHPPYRWLPRTIWPNLCSCWWDIRNGIRNLWRWLPLIWFDFDYDWEPLARIMEHKLRWMAAAQGQGLCVHRERHAREMRVCAEILRRLQNDMDCYYHPARHRLGDCRAAVKFSEAHERSDQRHLGLLLGKHLTHWWD